MKKTAIFISALFVLSLVSLETNAQQRIEIRAGDFSGMPRMEPVSKQILDNARYRVYYRMEFSQDVENLDLRTETQTILLIGERYSAFLDHNALRADSLMDAAYRSNAGLEETIRALTLGGVVRFRTTVIKNYPERGSFTFQESIMTDEHRYVDNDVNISWTLVNEEREIAGHVARKATTTFRGRDYIAWFAPSIPISEGPFVFSGLPGLILEIYDTENHYRFTINGFAAATEDTPIYLRNRNLVHSSRDDVRRMVRNLSENPGMMLQALSGEVTINAPGMSNEEVQRRLNRPRPFNPIERY